MFDFKFELDKNNISTFLTPGWRLLTIPKNQYKGRNNLNADATKKLKFTVDEKLIENYKDKGAVYDALKAIQEECGESYVELQYRITQRSDTLKCKLPARASEFLMAVFVASAVNYRDILLSKGEEKTELKKSHRDAIPWFSDNKEGFTLKIDSENAVITDINIYDAEGNNPFVEYSRKAMLQTSYSNVLDLKFDMEKDSKLRDFYSSVKGWVSASELKSIKKGDVKNVIYMLYDENKEEIYVGRADDLKERLEQHQNKTDDPIPEFTHYRYSIIDQQYVDYSYFIEDAAIHDCAAVFEMKKRKNLKESLQSAISKNRIKGDMNSIAMVNTAESQAHLRNKK